MNQKIVPPQKDKDGSIRWDYWINVKQWENDEYVVTIGGRPIGQSLDLQSAKTLSRWLATSMPEIWEASWAVMETYVCRECGETLVDGHCPNEALSFHPKPKLDWIWKETE